MKLQYATTESRRTRGGSKIWYMDKNTGAIRWTRPYYWITPVEIGWWWSEGLNKWIHSSQWDIYDDWCGNCSNEYPSPCMNHRKFRRLLKKWSVYLPEGLQFDLTGRLTGPRIVGTISKPRKPRKGNKIFLRGKPGVQE